MVLRGKKENEMAPKVKPVLYGDPIVGQTFESSMVPQQTKYDPSSMMTYQNPSLANSYQNGLQGNYFKEMFDANKPSAVSQVAQTAAPITTAKPAWLQGIDNTQNANQNLYTTGNTMEAELLGNAPRTDISGTQPVSYLGDAWKGTKDFFTPTSTADKMTQMRQDWQSGIGADYKPATMEGGVVTAPAIGTSFDEYTKQMNAQKLSDNQTFGTYAGAGMGAVQTGLGVLNYFDQKAMNKKNSQLIDQQIANNQDIMGTRKARAADITKYFG